MREESVRIRNSSRSSLVSNDVDLAFSSPSLPRLSQMVDPRWSQGRRGFGIGSALRKGIRLCFRTALKKKKKKSMRSRYRCVFNWKTVYSYSADWAESITAENTSRSNREMEIKVRNISVDHSPSSSLFLRILRIYPRINGRIPVSIPFFVDIGTIWFRFISNCFFFFLISCLVLIKFIIKFQYWFLSRWSMNE